MKRQDSRARLLDAAFAEVYKNGYHGTGTAVILKAAGVPKGSMYHFFASKKELVLAVSQERIVPKMDDFFDFARLPGENIFQTFARIFAKMQNHTALIANGCPLHRLLVEMAPLDPDFEAVLTKAYHHFIDKLSLALEAAIADGELVAFDTKAFARFFITSTWGEISLPPSLSSKESFGHHAQYLTIVLEHYRR
ncbi:TetR/AcrR family transcriptional regulator [Sulfurimonas sp. HSL-3221]|uniref:TetR/AcrR family transcriptional regulator n=1 Tax=Sulfurimonadaceae TaxID=2771471 RepID=UPI001E577F9A|nr:TetR/AcrR family transcriptional regulator [Sulfurimonas sp. HSL-3221]UFS63230.1 TetR/AcrR family transcriptional regulator [Sulfurimonas sp. HSL-3221]